jgi:hypothetical protein
MQKLNLDTFCVLISKIQRWDALALSCSCKYINSIFNSDEFLSQLRILMNVTKITGTLLETYVTEHDNLFGEVLNFNIFDNGKYNCIIGRKKYFIELTQQPTLWLGMVNKYNGLGNSEITIRYFPFSATINEDLKIEFSEIEIQHHIHELKLPFTLYTIIEKAEIEGSILLIT